MKLRKIGKMNRMNDGNRSLYESIFNRFVLTSIKYLSHNTDTEFVIINDLAVGYHSRPFMCKKIDVLVLDKNKVKFKYHKNIIRNDISFNILDINDVDISKSQFEYILNTSYISDNIRIISPTALMSLYLKDINNSRNAMYAEQLCENCPIKKIELFENVEGYINFIYSIKKDYIMSHIKNFEDYFKCKIYEGSSGYAEVDSAFKDWNRNTSDYENKVLIGGMAMINYDVDRMTSDVDFLFLSKKDIPSDITGFKRTREGAFQHNKTHVEIEVLLPYKVQKDEEFIQLVFDTAYIKNNFKIASPSAIVALKLSRFSNKDKDDIRNLMDNYDVDISIFMPYLSEEEIENYKSLC